MSNSNLPKVPNYFTLSLLAVIFLCTPTGIMAIINSARVNNELLKGNYQAAVLASERTKKWLWWSLILGLIVYTLFLFAMASGI